MRRWLIPTTTLAILTALAPSALRPCAAVAEPATQPVDVIVANDLLCIGIWDNRATAGENLKTVRVDSAGMVSLFYIGQLKLAGLNFEQAEKVIADTYRASG